MIESFTESITFEKVKTALTYYLSVFLLMFLAGEATAQLGTPLHIRSGMVVQRDHEIPLRGSAVGGAKVLAELNGFADSTTAL